MATQIPNPIIYHYTEFNHGKFLSVRHYIEISSNKNIYLLTSKINISLNQNRAKSNPDYWLKLRKENKWGKNITGLFKTGIAGIYRGDIDFKKHLLIFAFQNNGSDIKVYIFKNFYTANLNLVLHTYIHNS